MDDSFANIDARYIFKRIGAFEGIGDLTANLTYDLDEAFRRQARFTVE